MMVIGRDVYEESEIHQIRGHCLLSGMFSGSKQEYIGDVEICRLIVNLKPTSSNCQSLEGDTCTLPSATCLSSLFLDQDEMLVTSSEDSRCFFYLGGNSWLSGVKYVGNFLGIVLDPSGAS